MYRALRDKVFSVLEFRVWGWRFRVLEGLAFGFWWIKDQG